MHPHFGGTFIALLIYIELRMIGWLGHELDFGLVEFAFGHVVCAVLSL